MAVRHATLDLSDLANFLEQWLGAVQQGAVYLQPEEVPGELAPQIRLDFILPIAGRVGPVRAQVIHRAEDGGVGLRLPEIPAAVSARCEEVLQFIGSVRTLLIESGELVPAGEGQAAAPAPQPQQQAQAPAPSGEPAPPGTAAEPDQPVQRERGFPVPASVLSDEPDDSGPFGDRTFQELGIRLAVERSTGVLTVKLPDGSRKFGFWSKGGPVGWRSEPVDPDEVLGVLLFKAGYLTKEDLAESLEVMERTGCRQGEALIDAGKLSFSQLVMVLQKQTEFVLQRVIQQTRGEWSFHTVEELPERFIAPPLRVPSLFYQARREHARTLPNEDLYASLRPMLDRYVFIKPELEAVLAEITWTKGEKKFLEIVRSSSWRLRELFSVSNLSRMMTAAVMWALIDLRVMDFKAGESDDRYIGRIATRILSKAKQVHKANWFDVLEVHWICLPREVEAAYRKLKREFASDNYKQLTPELEAALKRINEKVELAMDNLRTDAQRRSYREEVIELQMIAQSASLLSTKGDMAIMKADRAEATACFEKASELVPGNGGYRAALNRAKTLAS